MINILSIKNSLFPKKKINFITIFTFLLGIIFGTVFLCILSFNDKNYVISKINSFISIINSGKLNYSDMFSNSILINISYILLIFVFGLTLIGMFIIIFIVFFKGFIIGFYLGSFIISYSYKGLFLSILYVLFSQGINIISIIIASIFGIIFSCNLFKNIFYKSSISLKKFIRIYLLLFFFLLIIAFLSSLLEVFVFPSSIKLIIKLFV